MTSVFLSILLLLLFLSRLPSILLATQPQNLSDSSQSLETHPNMAQGCQVDSHNSLQICPFHPQHLISDPLVDFHNTSFTSSPSLSLSFSAQPVIGHHSYFPKGRSESIILKHIQWYPLACT